MILLLILLQAKHLLLDFVFQPKWMWANKGTFGHPGGLVHAGLHGLATNIIVYAATQAEPSLCVTIGFIEFIIHYLIDWAKMNLNDRKGWRADNSPYFWWLLGLDQFLHQLCYIAILWSVEWAL